jgi:hypothetical protein
VHSVGFTSAADSAAAQVGGPAAVVVVELVLELVVVAEVADAVTVRVTVVGAREADPQPARVATEIPKVINRLASALVSEFDELSLMLNVTGEPCSCDCHACAVSQI